MTGLWPPAVVQSVMSGVWQHGMQIMTLRQAEHDCVLLLHFSWSLSSCAVVWTALDIEMQESCAYYLEHVEEYMKQLYAVQYITSVFCPNRQYIGCSASLHIISPTCYYTRISPVGYIANPGIVKPIFCMFVLPCHCKYHDLTYVLNNVFMSNTCVWNIALTMSPYQETFSFNMYSISSVNTERIKSN